MRKLLLTSGLIALWILVLSGGFAVEQWVRRPDFERGDIGSLKKYMTEAMHRFVAGNRLGSGALILLNNGTQAAVETFGDDSSGAPASPDETLFLLCSVSKAVSAWGVMKLVDEGRIGLDEPILPYLRRWRFEGSERFGDKVTIRHLLSHTSGLEDGFGFSGFRLDELKQTPEESLRSPRDVNMGTPHAAVIQNEPGTVFSYSSHGYTILQLLVEEMSGKSFNDYMKDAILNPLGMHRSSYETEDIISSGNATHLAPNYDADLRRHPHRKHTMMAGGSLRVTAIEFGRLLRAYMQDDILQSHTIDSMIAPQPGTGGSWGLGHELYGAIGSVRYIAGHGGGAFPRTGAAFRINRSTGNGIAIMMTGGNAMIDPLINDWMYWETGIMNFDIRHALRERGWHVAILGCMGAVVIIFLRKRNLPES